MYWAGADLEYRRRARMRDGSEEVMQKDDGSMRGWDAVACVRREGVSGSDRIPSSCGYMGFGDCACEQSHPFQGHRV